MRAIAASTSSIGCDLAAAHELGQAGGVVLVEESSTGISAAPGRR